MNINIHGVKEVKLMTTQKMTNTSFDTWYTSYIVITDSQGVIYRIDLYANEEENLLIKDL